MTKAGLIIAARAHLKAKDDYGYGRTFIDFLRHLWLVAVPDKGVNNQYDYPLGLPYLLCIGPFLWMFFLDLKRKAFTVVPFFIIIYWLLWWLGSQQARFLYILLIMIFIYVFSRIEPISDVLLVCLVFALCINALSIWRAHKDDFFVPMHKILRDKDIWLLKLNKEYLNNEGDGKSITIVYPEAAFARFPVMVNRTQLPFVLPMDKEYDF